MPEDNNVICASNGGVVEFYGHGNLAKELYDKSGIDTYEEID